MMKSFFKKLAFVMALAMVVSMAAPAATTASAASNLKIAYQNGKGYGISELNITEAGATEDLKFLGAPTNWKELGATWTSNNEAVATVNQNGIVTAVAPGTAEVAVQIGAEVAVVKVNVVNVATYTATMGTADDRNITAKTIEEGDTFDFAFYGIKDYDAARYFCTWASDDTSVATVDQKGLVTAVKAGTAKITLIVFNKVTGQVHNVDACTVTVPGEATPTPVVNNDAFTVAQKDTDKFVLTFAEAKTVEEIKENLTVSVKIGEQDFPISFENVTVDGKNVTVTTYAQFENEEVYTLTYGKEVVKHTIVLGGIANVGVTYYTGKNKDNKFAYVTEEEENDYVTLVPVLFDEYGNDVTDKYNLKNFDFVYEVSENVKPAQIYNDVFAFDAAGVATVNVTVAWVNDNGEYVEVYGKSLIDVIKRGSIGLTLEKAGIAPVGWLKKDNAYTYIADPADSFRLDPNSAVWNAWGGYCVGTSWEYRSVEAGRNLTYTAVFKDNRGNSVTSNDPAYQYGTFTYESTNNEVLTVDDITGSVALYKPGKANILVYFTAADGNGAKKLVASTPITVTPELYPASFKITKANITTAAHVIDEGLNNVKFKVQFYDQYNNVYDRDNDALIAAMKVEARDTLNTVTYDSIVWNDDYDNCYSIILDGTKFIPGLGANLQKSFSYKFSLEDTDVTETIKTAYSVFTLTVKDTEEERDILAAFLDSTKDGGDVYGVAAGVVPSNYKFNISLGGNTSVDVAVKEIKGYEATNASSLTKGKNISAKYLSTGNLALANVPKELLVDNTDAKATTGHMGYVYYKVSAPTKTTVAGNSVTNTDAWSKSDANGKVSLSFNKIVNGAFKYAGNGSYMVSFATTRTEAGNLYNVKTSTVTASNSQLQAKYLGINPETEGLTELAIVDTTAALDAIVYEQLMFSFDEVVLGNYFEGGNRWGAHKLTYSDYVDDVLTVFDKTVNTYIDWANSKYVVGNDSVTFSTLAIVVSLDNGIEDGEENANLTYTTMVPVGARIKAK